LPITIIVFTNYIVNGYLLEAVAGSAEIPPALKSDPPLIYLSKGCGKVEAVAAGPAAFPARTNILMTPAVVTALLTP
jgi:hypothetical protein